MNHPSKVDDCYRYWIEPPPERSGRCQYWIERIEAGWRPNSRIGSEGYDGAAHYYGVYIWEYIHEICPLLREIES